MRGRAQRIGMRIDIESARGQGTRVTLEFPLTRTAPLVHAAARG
jgi:nitrate/nitrite-specific signal transduction histidine kinase